jgi:two-component system phosphate regulon response regulator PhoB
MTARILVVESDDPPTLSLGERIEAAGFSVAILADEEAVARFECRRDLDLLILHWDLPRTPHIALSRLLKAQFQIDRTAAVIFAHRAAGGETVRAVPVGVYERIAQPIPFSDLFGRVKALASRSQHSEIADIVVAGELILDRKSRTVYRGQRALNLSLAPFRMLEFLMSNPGRVFTRRQLAHGLWGPDTNVDERTIDVEVGRIRGAMNRGRDADPIRTVRGDGYAFDETFGFRTSAANRPIRRRRPPPLRSES